MSWAAYCHRSNDWGVPTAMSGATPGLKHRHAMLVHPLTLLPAAAADLGTACSLAATQRITCLNMGCKSSSCA